MSTDERSRLARAYLLATTRLGDRDVTDLVWQYGPALAAELNAATTGGTWEREATAAVDQCHAAGLRLLVPGDEEWPAALAKDPWSAPIGLWVRGGGRLHELAARAVVVAGRKDATPYGVAATAEVGRYVAQAGWTVMNLGRFGVDSAALRGALQATPAGTTTPATSKPAAVLPLGRLVEPMPPAHDSLFRRVARDGVLVSEHGANIPPRYGHHDVQRQIALLVHLAAVVVLVEPNGQGWDNRLLRAAGDAARPVLALPGPTTSPQSHFAHVLIRAGKARLAAGHSDVLAELEGSCR